MINTTISHYQILRKLGEGGMGEVFLAEDTRLHRKAALKFLPPKFTADPDFKARFEREAQAAATFNHPNIITIYEIGEYQGRSYIAMEYAEGQSLRELIGREKPPFKRVLEIVVQVCAGLSKAHQAGIVHRDLKPANILLNTEGVVKIVDFGLAKVQGVSKLTRTGTLMGTVPYMSPEQVRGEELDPRSDIFSMGIVLYELLTGDLPFGADSELGVMYAIASIEPKPLAAYQLNVPPGLQNILDKALAKDLAKRYQRIEELATALKNLVEGDAKIKNYQLLQKLEAGGMGEVFLAEDRELGRKVVLKFLPAQYNEDPEFKARLKREAQAAAALNHPNIITIYEVGEYQGRAYIAMEYVEGESLKARIARQKLALPEIVDMMRQICAGMSKAHRAGVLHRDIKPANILINLDGQVKVIDFGLAKMQGVSKLTQAGTLMGTIPYMSPEQVHGQELDPRSDIFSLGVVLYELLTRELPFKGESQFTLMNAIAREQPAKLDRYPLDAPPELQRLMDKVLAKNLEARYQRVDDLSADLKKLLKPSTSPPPPKPKPDLEETVAIDQPPSKLPFKLSRPPRLWLAVSALIILAVFAVFLIVSKKAAMKTTLSLSTQPPGVAVFLNGDSLGMTPFNAPTDQEGAVTLRFRKRNYLALDTTVFIQKGVPQNFSAALRPVGRIAIAVDPPDAEVQVDGEMIPASRLAELELAVGAHEIRVSRPGYDMKQEQLQLRAGDNAARRYTLEKLGPGVGGVDIDSQPSGAAVTFDRVRAGSTRYQAQNLKPRRYPFSLSLNGYETFTGNLTVRAGQTTSLNIPLKPVRVVASAGQLSVKSEPGGAAVIMDGKEVGVTSYQDNNVPPGKYEIVLRKKGYKDYSTSITVEAGRLSSIEKNLSPAFGTLQVLIKPFGSIYVDGKLEKKDANFRFPLELQTGPHQLKVTHPNYGAYEKTVRLEANAPQEFEVDFNRQFAVTVTSTDETGGNPVWSNIEVDGKPSGNTTPKQLTLRFGTHTVEVKREGYAPVDGPMTINVEKNMSLMFRLKKLP